MNKDNYIHTPYNDEWIAQRADPFVYRHTDGTCYFTASVPAYDRIILRAANDLGGLVHAEEKTLWVRHEADRRASISGHRRFTICLADGISTMQPGIKMTSGTSVRMSCIARGRIR